MGLFDAVARFMAIEPLQTLSTEAEVEIAARLVRQYAARPWRVPSVEEALGIPAIQRAVTLIANTTGSLAMQGFRNGAAMSDPPRLIVRPDPYGTPRDFFRDWAYGLATRGEQVQWIATRDPDGLPAALINVPYDELRIEDNPRNRFFPVYRWGTLTGTRYSTAYPQGAFVHTTYLKLRPLDLHGVGPLQLAMAAASVAVESQEWAANFYADGGNGGTIIKASGFLAPGEDGEREADKLRDQWVSRPNNIPRVIDDSIEEVKQADVNPQGAQMLAARDYQNGEAARLFGIPGKLLEYSSPGSSLTYQNVTEVFTDFVKGCLAPNYLEPIEAAMSDLLARTTSARFNVNGFLRADIKTRFDVYNIGIPLGVLSPEDARQAEGMAPGNAEYAPVPAAPPNAVPTFLPRRSVSQALPEPFRCTGMRMLRGVETMCNAKMAPGFVGTCHRCKKVYRAA